MKNYLFKFFLLFSVTALPLFAAETLADVNRLFAVHASKTIIKNKRIEPTFIEKEEILKEFPQLIPELIPDFRTTIHFSLGELMRPLDDEDDIEKSLCAVVIPLTDLMPQVVNLNCYDTFIMGSCIFTPRTTLVLPKECQNDPTFNTNAYSVFFYDQSKKTLRQAVDELIAEKGGWSIRMLDNVDEDKLNEAYLNDENINTKEFFAPLLADHHYISVGCRSVPCDGDAYILGSCEDNLCFLAGVYLPISLGDDKEFVTKDVIEARKMVAQEFELLIKYVNNLPFRTGRKKVFEQKKQAYSDWMNILDADLRARKSHRKTLMKAPMDVWVSINENKGSLKALNQLIDKIRAKLPAAK